MRFITKALFFIIATVVFTGCGSSPATNSPAANSNSGAANTTVLAPSNTTNEAPHAGGPANEANVNSMAALSNRRPISMVNSTGPAPSIPTRPAAEDSEIATTMNKDGMVVESRKFNSHPQLARVEILWKSPTDKVVTIYLKNGKKVETSGEHLDNISTVSTQTLLEMAGVKGTQPPKPPDAGKVPGRRPAP